MQLEQRRRDFKKSEPELYEYIALRESAKALKEAGDVCAGASDEYAAANRVYERAARAVKRWEELNRGGD